MSEVKRAAKKTPRKTRAKAQATAMPAAEEVAAPADEQSNWVQSYEQLAQIIGCHHHSFPRWTKKHLDAPAKRQNGQHSVSAWREFFQRHPDIGIEVECERKSFLENRIREEKLEALVTENAKLRGALIELSQVEAWLSDKIEQQRQLLQQVYERDLPAKLEGLRVPQIVEKMIEARNRIQKPMQELARQLKQRNAK
jgi:hypothetical protein